ncbi:unnamed protein product [Schistosoma turkestanicum]|nr:unnamed protein product [Schistosoma turkestanicum]
MFTNSLHQNNTKNLYERTKNRKFSFHNNSKENVRKSSLPMQLDHVDQYYFESMKSCPTSKYFDENPLNPKTCYRYYQKPLTTTITTTTTTSTSSSYVSAEFQNLQPLCCLCCNNNDDSNHDKISVHYLTSCCNSRKFQRVVHNLILISLGISIVFSIILSLLGIFLNYRSCLTAGCILGIASFGALLHGCLRHRTLPNSPIPIILGRSYMHPIMNNIPVSVNQLFIKHQQYPQRLLQQQQQLYDFSRNVLIKHPYFISTDDYCTNNQDYKNSKNNRNENMEIFNKRNLDNLCNTYQLKSTNDMEYSHSANKRNMDYSSESPSITCSVSGNVVVTTANTTASPQKCNDDNYSNKQNTYLCKNSLKPNDCKSVISTECEICRVDSSNNTNYKYKKNNADCTHSNNIINELKNNTPRSISSIRINNARRPESMYLDLRDLALPTEIKAESQDQTKHTKPSQQNTFTHVQHNLLNSCDTGTDKQSHSYYFEPSSFCGKQNLLNHNININKQVKSLNYLMIYPKFKSRNQIMLSNYSNFLNGLCHHVNQSQRQNYHNERYDGEYNHDIFGPRTWQSWGN